MNTKELNALEVQLNKDITKGVEDLKNLYIDQFYEKYCSCSGRNAEIEPTECLLVLSLGHSTTNKIEDFVASKTMIVEDLRRAEAKCFLQGENIYGRGECSIKITRVHSTMQSKPTDRLFLPEVKRWTIEVDGNLIGIVTAHLNVGPIRLVACKLHQIYCGLPEYSLNECEIQATIEKKMIPET